MKFPVKVSKTFEKLSNFRNLTKIPEISGEKCNRMEILGKKFSKIRVYHARFSSFPEIFQ